MSAVMIGGMDRLHREYIETAKAFGIELKVFTGQERSLKKCVGDADLVILCTGKVSHSARNEARKHASAKNIPVHMIHSAGVSALRCCMEQCSLADKSMCPLCATSSRRALYPAAST